MRALAPEVTVVQRFAATFFLKKAQGLKPSSGAPERPD
jgi:hypothetical protein